MNKDNLKFPEPITKVYVSETLSKDGCKLNHLIINEKWKLTPTNNPEKPFKKSRIK